ncbi:hypothetical protein AB0L75_35465 [Streptomyces sp. NPDC052101]|uniref:hypothetical protein n=1 Tax=Streptomyces sp. NPDC052101 TaxID=3155763 RepID=UPI00342DAE6C
MRQPTDDGFVLAVERWTPEVWQEYRDRVADQPDSAAVIDRINRRRRRETPAAAEAER